MENNNKPEKGGSKLISKIDRILGYDILDGCSKAYEGALDFVHDEIILRMKDAYSKPGQENIFTKLTEKNLASTPKERALEKKCAGLEAYNTVLEGLNRQLKEYGDEKEGVINRLSGDKKRNEERFADTVNRMGEEFKEATDGYDKFLQRLLGKNKDLSGLNRQLTEESNENGNLIEKLSKDKRAWIDYTKKIAKDYGKLEERAGILRSRNAMLEGYFDEKIAEDWAQKKAFVKEKWGDAKEYLSNNKDLLERLVIYVPNVFVNYKGTFVGAGLDLLGKIYDGSEEGGFNNNKLVKLTRAGLGTAYSAPVIAKLYSWGALLSGASSGSGAKSSEEMGFIATAITGALAYRFLKDSGYSSLREVIGDIKDIKNDIANLLPQSTNED